MSGKRISNDKNKYIIELYRYVQQNGVDGVKNLPDYISQEQYQHIKNNPDENMVLTALAGFGLSYAGKWFGGYLKDMPKYNNYYLSSAKKSLIKMYDSIKNVQFESGSYTQFLGVKNALVYCDPPYLGTIHAWGVEEFDNDMFWENMRMWSQYSDVYISEYGAPYDFECVFEIETKTCLRDNNKSPIKRVERIFKFNG